MHRCRSDFVNANTDIYRLRVVYLTVVQKLGLLLTDFILSLMSILTVYVTVISLYWVATDRVKEVDAV